MVNAWENLFFVAKTAVEKREVSDADLIRLFEKLQPIFASGPEEDRIGNHPTIVDLNTRWAGRHQYVMYSGDPDRPEDDEGEE